MRGATSEDHFADDTALMADCFPRAQESYDTFAVDSKKLESRRRQPYGLGRIIRDANHVIKMFCLCYGFDHKLERLDALDVMARMRESHFDFPTAQTWAMHWGAMNFRYLAAVGKGAWRLARIPPDAMGNGHQT